VVQQGPLTDIAALVQTMPPTSKADLAKLAHSDVTDFRQRSVQQLMIHGRETAEAVLSQTAPSAMPWR
jgi:hypothetical protein